MRKNRGRSLFILACVLPAALLFILFMIVPTFNVFKMSLYKWGGYTPIKTFVGLRNFRILFADPNFFQAFQNTVLLIVIVTVVTISLALLYAGILTREKIKGQNFFRVIFYIPNILSVVVIAAIFSAIYDSKYGMLDSFLSLFNHGGKTIYWLGDENIVVFSLIIALIWQAVGYYMGMYMSGISAIPIDLFECAVLEGSGHIRQFFSITIPLIWTNIRTTLTFFIISTINLSFLFVQAMTDGGPNGRSQVFLSYMYDQAYTNSSYGYGMAIGVIVFLFSFALSAAVNAVTKRETVEL